MRAVLTAVIAAIEAAAVALAGFVWVAIPIALIWWLTFDLGTDPGVLVAGAAGGWMLAHLVPLTFTLDAEAMLGLGLPPETLGFVVSLAPLGVTALTALLAARAGARFARRGGVGSAGVLGGAIGFGLAAATIAGIAAPVRGWPLALSILVPVAIFIIGSGVGFLVRGARDGHEWWRSTVRWIQRVVEKVNGLWASRVPILASDTIRLATGALVSVIGLGAVAVAVALVGGYVGVITLSQGLQLDWVGLLTVFLLGISLLPVFAIWAVSWLSGSGFAIGAGTSVTPFETLLGPLPAFPLLGAVPQGWGGAGAIAPALLVILGIGIGAYASTRSELRRSLADRSILGSVAVVLCATVLVGLAVAGLAWLATGSIGPGRLSTVGPEPWPVAGLVALELGVGLLLGVFACRIDLARVRGKVHVAAGVDPIRDAMPAEQMDGAASAETIELADISSSFFEREAVEPSMQEPAASQPVEHEPTVRAPATAQPEPPTATEDPLLRAYSWGEDGESGRDSLRTDTFDAVGERRGWRWPWSSR